MSSPRHILVNIYPTIEAKNHTDVRLVGGVSVATPLWRLLKNSFPDHIKCEDFFVEFKVIAISAHTRTLNKKDLEVPDGFSVVGPDERLEVHRIAQAPTKTAQSKATRAATKQAKAAAGSRSATPQSAHMQDTVLGDDSPSPVVGRSRGSTTERKVERNMHDFFSSNTGTSDQSLRPSFITSAPLMTTSSATDELCIFLQHLNLEHGTNWSVGHLQSVPNASLVAPVAASASSSSASSSSAAAAVGVQPDGIDVLVITPIREEFYEFLGFIKTRCIDGILKPQVIQGTAYTGFSLEGPGGAKKCLVCCCAQMSNLNMAIKVIDSCTIIKPKLMVMLGIAGVVDQKEAKVGDVWIAESVFIYDNKSKVEVEKVADGQAQGFKTVFLPQEFQVPTSAVMSSITQLYSSAPDDEMGIYAKFCQDRCPAATPDRRQAYEDAGLLKTLRTDWSGTTMHTGVIAAGQSVIKCEEFGQVLLTMNPSIAIVAMEEGGVVAAFTRSAQMQKLATKYLIMRGISDPGNELKKKLDELELAGEKGVCRKWAIGNVSHAFFTIMATTNKADLQ